METLVVRAQIFHCDAQNVTPIVLEKLQHLVLESPSQGHPRHLLQQLSAPNFLPDSVSSAGYRMRTTLIVSTSTVTVYRTDQAVPSSRPLPHVFDQLPFYAERQHAVHHTSARQRYHDDGDVEDPGPDVHDVGRDVRA